MQPWHYLILCYAVLCMLVFFIIYILRKDLPINKVNLPENFSIGQFEFTKVYDVLNKHQIHYGLLPVMNKDNELVNILIEIPIRGNNIVRVFDAFEELDNLNLKTISKKLL